MAVILTTASIRYTLTVQVSIFYSEMYCVTYSCQKGYVASGVTKYCLSRYHLPAKANSPRITC